jgi:glutaconate CoA-transferase subunit A
MSKVVSMGEAIRAHVPDGASVAMGTCLEPSIPFAAGHEIIRHGRRDLTLIGPISDMLFDQLIGAGCVARVVAAWVGNVSEGLAHCYRRAVEAGEPHAIEVRDHSNFSIALALWAAAWGVPYLPTRSLLGSDILRSNPDLRVVGGLVQVGAVRPDVTILHVQRCDAQGRAHAWGPLGISEEAGLAAARVIVCCEELVGEEVSLSDPNRILLPETKVVAVVHEPGGSLPSPLQGHWRRDHGAYRDYSARTRSAEGYAEWLEEWVRNVPDRSAYLSRLDVEGLRVRRRLPSVPVDYGYE